MNSAHRAIGIQHREGVGSRPTIGGTGIGPWLDEKSADFLVRWLVVSRSDIQELALSIAIDATLEEAMGIGRASPSPVGCPLVEPVAIEDGERRGPAGPPASIPTGRVMTYSH